MSNNGMAEEKNLKYRGAYQNNVEISIPSSAGRRRVCAQRRLPEAFSSLGAPHPVSVPVLPAEPALRWCGGDSGFSGHVPFTA